MRVVGRTRRRSAAGEFTADVELQPGGNVIDVTATSPGRRSATDAVRVVRDMRVDVPNVVGQSPDDATAALKDAGLDGRSRSAAAAGSTACSAAPQVCATRPPAGARWSTRGLEA